MAIERHVTPCFTGAGSGRGSGQVQCPVEANVTGLVHVVNLAHSNIIEKNIHPATQTVKSQRERRSRTIRLDFTKFKELRTFNLIALPKFLPDLHK